MRTVSSKYACDRCGATAVGRRAKPDDPSDGAPQGWGTLFGYELCQPCCSAWSPIGLRHKQAERNLDKMIRRQLKSFLSGEIPEVAQG